jgi:hypothetical protein
VARTESSARRPAGSTSASRRTADSRWTRHRHKRPGPGLYAEQRKAQRRRRIVRARSPGTVQLSGLFSQQVLSSPLHGSGKTADRDHHVSEVTDMSISHVNRCRGVGSLLIPYLALLPLGQPQLGSTWSAWVRRQRHRRQIRSLRQRHQRFLVFVACAPTGGGYQLFQRDGACRWTSTRPGLAAGVGSLRSAAQPQWGYDPAQPGLMFGGSSRDPAARTAPERHLGLNLASTPEWKNSAGRHAPAGVSPGPRSTTYQQRRQPARMVCRSTRGSSASTTGDARSNGNTRPPGDRG